MQTTYPIGQQAWRRAWVDPEMYATSLFLMFCDKYRIPRKPEEDDPLGWDPHTILLHIEEDFDVAMPAANFDRLMTAIAIVTTDAFHKLVPDFINFCEILAGSTFDPRVWQPPGAAEIAWGITEALILSPPDEGEAEPFSPDIAAFIGQALDAEGIENPPDVLQIATGRAQTMPDAYTDDPETFTAINEVQRRKSEDISTMLRDNLLRLMQQIDSLPLANSDPKNSVRKLFGALPAAG